MTFKHKCAIDLSRSISIAIAGAGGTGCALAASLGRMSKTLRSLFPDYRMRLAIYDPAPVRDANLGRQPYGTFDVGLNKTQALANAMGMAFPVECVSHPDEFQRDFGQQIIAICVDSATARRQILGEIIKRGFNDLNYIIDCGNMRDFGQCIIGLNPAHAKLEDGKTAMPPPWDAAPDLYDPAKDNPSEPSCSTIEALANQDFNINHFVAMVASEHIWRLITKGELETCGAFFNLRTMSCSPLRMNIFRQAGDVIDGHGQGGERYRLSLLDCGEIRYLKHETICRDGSYNVLNRVVNGELIDPLTMTPCKRQRNALWRNIDALLNQEERLAA